MRILINCPHLNQPAGVSNHYTGLKPYFSESVKYNIITTRSNIGIITKNKIAQKLLRLFFIPYDYLKFLVKILFCNVSTVLLNPSFIRSALIRDGLYLQIAKFFKKKVVVFIHGWNQIYTAKAINNPEIFKTYKKADAFVVLAHEFKDNLRKFGISTDIFLTTTKVDDQLIKNFDINSKKYNHKRILFLARIEEAKGIYVAIQAFQLIKKKYDDASFTIVGNGSELENLKIYIKTNNIKDVVITGALSGDSLINEFEKASIYILPTYGEGMPTSVLEAMAFGLPIISRPVGGLNDFFEEGKMGSLSGSTDAPEFAVLIEKLFEDQELMKKIGLYNHLYAKEHFMASKVALGLEKLLNTV